MSIDSVYYTTNMRNIEKLQYSFQADELYEYSKT